MGSFPAGRHLRLIWRFVYTLWRHTGTYRTLGMYLATVNRNTVCFQQTLTMRRIVGASTSKCVQVTFALSKGSYSRMWGARLCCRSTATDLQTLNSMILTPHNMQVRAQTQLINTVEGKATRSLFVPRGLGGKQYMLKWTNFKTTSFFSGTWGICPACAPSWTGVSHLWKTCSFTNTALRSSYTALPRWINFIVSSTFCSQVTHKIKLTLSAGHEASH